MVSLSSSPHVAHVHARTSPDRHDSHPLDCTSGKMCAPGVGCASETHNRSSSTPVSPPTPRCAMDGSTAHLDLWAPISSHFRFLFRFWSGVHNTVRPPHPRTHRLHEAYADATPMLRRCYADATPMHTPYSHEQRHGVILEQIGQVDKELCGIGAIYDAVIARERHLVFGLGFGLALGLGLGLGLGWRHRHLLHHADHAVLLEHGGGRRRRDGHDGPLARSVRVSKSQ